MARRESPKKSRKRPGPRGFTGTAAATRPGGVPVRLDFFRGQLVGIRAG